MKIKDAAELAKAIYELRYQPTTTIDGARFPPIPATLDQVTEAADALQRTRQSTIAGLPITVARDAVKWAITALVSADIDEFVIAAKSHGLGATPQPAPAPTRSPADEPMNSDDHPQLPDEMLLAMTTARIKADLQIAIDNALTEAKLGNIATVYIRRALAHDLAASADTRLFVAVRHGEVTQAEAARYLGLTRARVSQIVGHQHAEASRLGLV